MNASIVFRYFPELSDLQKQQIEALGPLYRAWNAKINVISRKDMDCLFSHHILHALAIARFIQFKKQERVLDVGTGGGFPGLPLAILFPDSHFTLVDSIGKKIKVVQAIATAIGLQNVTAIHGRAESVKGKFHFVVSRAVTRLGEFYPWVCDKFERKSRNTVPNGILYLKGGDLSEEIRASNLPANLIPISRYFDDPFFETKYIVQVPV